MEKPSSGEVEKDWTMTDFVSMEESLAFLVLGPVPPVATPLDTHEQYMHGVALVDAGVDPVDYGEMMYRFQRTFRPDAKAPGGGDVFLE